MMLFWYTGAGRLAIAGLSMVLLLVLVAARCGTGDAETQPEASASQTLDSTHTPPTLSSRLQTPTPTSIIQAAINPENLYPRSLDEMISRSDVIVRASLLSVTVETETVSGDEGASPTYRPVHKLRFTAHEYVKGSGLSEIVVVVRPRHTHPTEAEARDLADWLLSQRNTTWDNRQALLFLIRVTRDLYRDWYDLPTGAPSSGDSTSVDTFGFAQLGNNVQSVWDYAIDTLSRVWLPSSSTAGVSTSNTESMEFITDGATSPHSVISLADLRAQKEELEATLKAGEGIEGYAACIALKLANEQHRRANPDWPTPTDEKMLISGLAAGTEVYRKTDHERRATDYHNYWLSGDDMDLFQAVRIDDDSDPKNGYDHTLDTARPLPTGVYHVRYNWQTYSEIPCNYKPDDAYVAWTVTVTAPDGTLHELFFDPVTVGSTVSADGTNGVLKPAAFTASNGASATVESISYESPSPGSGQTGTVRVKVVPWSVFSGQILDFIELDGRVSLSLSVTNSTFHSADNEFVWPMGPQPWEDGDKLMIRIRPGFAAIASPPASVTATASGGESVNLSWDAGRGASGYQVQRRESGVETWATEDDSVTERSYVVSGLSCETSYDFRVGAYGDGRKYEAEVKSWSATVSETTGACTQPPTFDASSYSFEVSEDAAAGTQVGTVSATDPDEGDTLTYSIVSGNEAGKFAVDGSTGIITVAGTLDYDTASSYTLTVQASDGKGGTARATVTIGVVEVVDTGAPVFGASAYAFSVIDGAPVGSTVGAVSATDPNEGDTVTYSITAGNDAGKFGLDAGTGRITLTGTLDYQTTAAYTLTVEASDGKDGKGTATVTVSVEQASCSNGTAVASPSDNAGLVKDCLTLLALRDSLEGTVVLNWSSDVAIGNWKGVGVAGTPGRVQSLSLSDLGLDGTVPSALAKLSGLELLELSENDLTGAIPTELSGLTRLGRLSLGQNRLTGSIPPSLSRLSNLYSLAVGDNDLSGSIPSTLGSLSRLIYLSLGGNDLTGTIPSELGSLASLQYLYLDTNDLTGGIPTQLGSLAKLEILSLYGNKLTGGIPSELGNLSKLEQLMLSRNGLTGSIPTSLERLSKLVYLRLSGNRLTGCIPASLRNVTDHDLGRLSLAYCAAEA